MSKKKVLVTGLNGVVGSGLRPTFEDKYELVLLDYNIFIMRRICECGLLYLIEK